MTIPYPMTIITTRYRGTYSGGQYACFPLYHDDVPADALGSDIECAEFWNNNRYRVGVGSDVFEAMADAIMKDAWGEWDSIYETDVNYHALSGKLQLALMKKHYERKYGR